MTRWPLGSRWGSWEEGGFVVWWGWLMKKDCAGEPPLLTSPARKPRRHVPGGCAGPSWAVKAGGPLSACEKHTPPQTPPTLQPPPPPPPPPTSPHRAATPPHLFDVPDLRGTVLARADEEAAVGRPGDLVHCTDVAGERGEEGASAAVPDLDLLIKRRAGEVAAIGREGDVVDRLRGACQCAQGEQWRGVSGLRERRWHAQNE